MLSVGLRGRDLRWRIIMDGEGMDGEHQGAFSLRSLGGAH